jgi:cytochrome P450
MSPAIPADYDPCRPEWRADPYPHYRALRDAAPVYCAPATRVYCVSRYEHVSFALRSPELFSSRAMFSYLMNQGREGRPPFSWAMLRFVLRFVWHTRLNPFEFATARNLIAEDGASHAAMRAIVNRGFTPRRIAAWEGRARELVAESMAKLRAGSPFDLVEDLAVPLPVTVIAEMLGVEPARRADFKRWSDAIIETSTGPGRSDPFRPRMVDAIVELATYLRALAEQRAREPADDLVSAIAAEQEGASALTIREVIQFVMLLLVAGNETTTNLIGNAVTALLDHPQELARVAADPALVPAAIEETLRFDPPVQMVFRNTTRDVELAGTRIPQGAYVALLLGSANRDERRFPDPDRFDLARQTQGHLGFGFGEHFCLGASLARLEARVALEALVPELARLERHGPRELVDSFLVRGPRHLPLRRAA